MRTTLTLAAALILGAAVAVPASGSTVPAAAAPAGPASVLLPTGDQLTLTTVGGRQLAGLIPAEANGIGRSLVQLRWPGHNEEIPADALPYLGNGLDPSLFDLTSRTGTTVPVQVGYQGSAPAVPGLTVTSTSGNTQRGYLTLAGAKQFGAALAKQYLADRATGSFGGHGLFANGVTIDTPGAPVPAATPHFPMHTVTVAGSDLNGKADTGSVVLLANVDDFARGFQRGQLYNGQARFSVPVGNYLALAVYYDTDSAGDLTSVHEVIRTQFAVTGDQTLRMDERQASSEVSMTAPKPTIAEESGFELHRTDATGKPTDLGVQNGPGVPTWVSPQPAKVTVGTLNSYPIQRLSSPPGPGTPYEYDLEIPTSGVIPAQHYTVAAAQLATIDETDYSDFPTAGYWISQSLMPFEYQSQPAVQVGFPVTYPLQLTRYVLGDPSVLWIGQFTKYVLQDGAFTWFYGVQHDQFRGYRAGQTTHEGWNQYPLHPTGAVDLGSPAAAQQLTPVAVRAGDTVSFNLTPFSDNQPGHNGFGFAGESRDTITGTWELDQNGTKVAGGNAVNPQYPYAFEEEATVAPAAGTLHLVLDASRVGPMYTLSTASHTEWTWKSSHEQGVTLPAPWVCGSFNSGPAGSACAVEPLLDVNYDVANLDEAGAVPYGTQGLDLTVGHLQRSAASAVTDAQVQYSLDDGTTWQNASTKATGNGVFHASYDIPEPAQLHGFQYVSFRVTAHDAAGGAITETTTRAYVLTPAA